MSDVLDRLRSATAAELSAIAHHLRVDLGPAADVNLVRLSDAFEEVAGPDYRDALKQVGVHVAAEASWKPGPDINELTEDAWIEEYIYLAFMFLHREDRQTLGDKETAELQETANRALSGLVPTAKEKSDGQLTVLTAAVGVGIGIVFWELMLAGAAVVAAAKLLKNLFGGNAMKRLAPAVLILIHVHKRVEYESVLTHPEAA